MSNLSSTFDILRGWPNGCALWWEFQQKAAVTPNISEGEVVAVEAGTAGKGVVDRYDSVLATGTNMDYPWLVIQGKDQFDGQFTGTLTCLKLRSGVVFKIATALTMSVGDLVWSDGGGVFTNVDPGSSAPAIGKVIQIDPVNGWVVIES